MLSLHRSHVLCRNVSCYFLQGAPHNNPFNFIILIMNCSPFFIASIKLFCSFFKAIITQLTVNNINCTIQLQIHFQLLKASQLFREFYLAITIKNYSYFPLCISHLYHVICVGEMCLLRASLFGYFVHYANVFYYFIPISIFYQLMQLHKLLKYKIIFIQMKQQVTKRVCLCTKKLHNKNKMLICSSLLFRLCTSQLKLIWVIKKNRL